MTNPLLPPLGLTMLFLRPLVFRQSPHTSKPTDPCRVLPLPFSPPIAPDHQRFLPIAAPPARPVVVDGCHVLCVPLEECTLGSSFIKLTHLAALTKLLTGSRRPVAPPVFPIRAASGERSEDPTAPPAVVLDGAVTLPPLLNANYQET